MKNNKSIHEHVLDVENAKHIKSLEDKIIHLEEEIHHLEDENKHLEDRLNNVTREVIETDRVSTKIEKPIVVSDKDPFNSELGDRKTLNARRNFFLFFDYHYHSVLRSKMLWVLLVTLPIIFTLIYHVMFSMEITDVSNELSWYNSLLESGDNSPTVISKILELNLEYSALAGQLCSNLTNWLFAIPLIVFTCILFPLFITTSREDNLLKRLTINSMNRSQIFWFYILSSTIIFSAYLFIMYGFWMALLNALSESIFHSEIWEGALSVYSIGNIGLFKIFVLGYIFFFGLSALSFKKSMTVKTSRELVGWGTGIFIFSQFAKLSVGIFDLKPFAVEMGMGEATDIVIGAILFTIKWMFVMTIPTLVFVAFSTASRGVSKFKVGGLQVDEFQNAWYSNSDLVFNLLQLTAVLICIAIFIYVWYNKDKIIKFEAQR